MRSHPLLNSGFSLYREMRSLVRSLCPDATCTPFFIRFRIRRPISSRKCQPTDAKITMCATLTGKKGRKPAGGSWVTPQTLLNQRLMGREKCCILAIRGKRPKTLLRLQPRYACSLVYQSVSCFSMPGDQDSTAAPKHSTTTMCIQRFKLTSAPFKLLSLSIVRSSTASIAGSSLITLSGRYTGPISRLCRRYRFMSRSDRRSKVSAEVTSSFQFKCGLTRTVATTMQLVFASMVFGATYCRSRIFHSHYRCLSYIISSGRAS